MMNQVTRDIAANLKVSLGDASMIQYALECDDFDFSACSNRQLYSAAKRAYRDILAESMEIA
jgi:hypothetical protein